MIPQEADQTHIEYGFPVILLVKRNKLSVTRYHINTSSCVYDHTEESEKTKQFSTRKFVFAVQEE